MDFQCPKSDSNATVMDVMSALDSLERLVERMEEQRESARHALVASLPSDSPFTMSTQSPFSSCRSTSTSSEIGSSSPASSISSISEDMWGFPPLASLSFDATKELPPLPLSIFSGSAESTTFPEHVPCQLSPPSLAMSPPALSLPPPLLLPIPAMEALPDNGPRYLPHISLEDQPQFPIRLDGVLTRFCTKKVYPPFHVICENESQPTTGLYVAISLVAIEEEGDQDKTMYLSGKKRFYQWETGKLTVHGLRFDKVSSRFGSSNHDYVLRVQVLTRTDRRCVAQADSPPIYIKSERLQNAKAANLTPFTPLKKIKGVGNLYSSRLEELYKITTVQDLADLPRESLMKVLVGIRRDRGTMSFDKLKQLWKRCTEVMKQEYSNRQSPTSPIQSDTLC